MDERPPHPQQPTAVRAAEGREPYKTPAASAAVTQRTLVVASLLRCPEHIDEVGGG